MDLTAAVSVRRAKAEDYSEVIRLAEAMYEHLNFPGLDSCWKESALEMLALRHGRDAMVLVVSHPEETGKLVACGAGSWAMRLPSPRSPSGKTGYIQWMFTEPSYRGRGLATAILSGLLEWFGDQGVIGIELHAAPKGDPIYRSLGFSEGPSPSLRLFLTPPLD